jgi:uncharacterized cupredoxin-like copper-binding protein
MRNLKLAACSVAALALIGGGVLAGCGDDDDEGGEETSEVVEEVTLTADDAGGDYTFELSDTPTADTKTVVFDNQGAQPHVLIFARLGEGYTVDEAYELEGEKGSAETLLEGQAKPGESDTLTIKDPIEPGNYVMLCPIPGPGGEPHYKLGQLEEFTIE